MPAANPYLYGFLFGGLVTTRHVPAYNDCPVGELDEISFVRVVDSDYHVALAGERSRTCSV